MSVNNEGIVDQPQKKPKFLYQLNVYFGLKDSDQLQTFEQKCGNASKSSFALSLIKKGLENGHQVDRPETEVLLKKMFDAFMVLGQQKIKVPIHLTKEEIIFLKQIKSRSLE